MTHKMDRYVKALGGHSMVPGNLLRENVRTMRTLEESFKLDLRGMLVALGRKDMGLVEKAIEHMEQTMNEARALVNRVNEEDEKKDNPFEKKKKDKDSDDDKDEKDDDDESEDEDEKDED